MTLTDVQAELLVSIAPKFMGKELQGIHDYLNQLVLKQVFLHKKTILEIILYY